MGHQMVLFIEHYGYLAVFLLIMLEDFGLPAPGETALVVASVAAAAGKFNIWGVLAAAVAGAIIGDNIGYAIGHFGGRRLVVAVLGRVGLGHDKFVHAEGVFKRYGDAVVVGARFVEVLRQLNGVIAGTMGMHWATFLAFNAMGAAIWVGVWGAVGYFAGSHLRQIEWWFMRFSWLALVALIAAAIVYWVVRRRRVGAEAAANAAVSDAGTRPKRAER
jgi:membrane protein DedA with SNARE-associated domain